MEKRYWLTSVGMGRLRLTKSEPFTDHSAAVAVRPAEPGIAWDGVWVNGARSFDTRVIVNGVVAYRVPAEDQSTLRSFELHEAAGSREVLTA